MSSALGLQMLAVLSTQEQRRQLREAILGLEGKVITVTEDVVALLRTVAV